jgi:hypothetical protein
VLFWVITLRVVVIPYRLLDDLSVASSGFEYPNGKPIVEEGTDRVSRNFSKELQLLAAKEPRRAQFSCTSRRKPEITQKLVWLKCQSSLQYCSKLCSTFTFMLPRIVINFFLITNQTHWLFILFCYKTLHVSGILSSHHQEFSTVHSALVSFMQFWWPLPTRVRMELVPSWLCLEAVINQLHVTYQCRMYSTELLIMAREDGRNM